MPATERDWNMQRDAITAAGLVVRQEVPLFKRLLSKLVVDVLPATVVSALGGFIITQYQFSHTVMRPATVQVVPASAEMMQLVRDEHAVIVDYLKTQLAEEKSRHAAEDAADASARAAADDQAATTAMPAATAATAATAAPVALPAARPATTIVAAKPVTHAKVAVAPTALPPHAPLMIAQADQPLAAAPPTSAPAEQKSLLTRTIEIKDHVVGATLHAVSAIGSLPSWIASMGDRIGGGDTTPTPVVPAARQFTTS
jgi:hypothetical protein